MIKKTVLFILISLQAFAEIEVPAVPNPPRLVNDFVGGLLSPSQINALESKLKAYNDSTSTQISIVIVKSVQPYDVFDYAQELFRKWKIGAGKKNNGILLLWAPGDRKVRIHTGYGMEGSITDARSKRIISQIIGPNFKELRYYEGLDEATSQIINYAQGEFQAEPVQENSGGDLSTFLVVFLIFMIVVWLMSKNNGNNNDRGGRGYRSSGSGWPYWTMGGGGSYSGNWGGGGGSWGGGGGGFGGFGGGDSGGGGASGDY